MIREILVAADVVTGTHCGNCKFTKGSKEVEAKLNEQGGTIPKNDKDMELAKDADLITMPGKAEPKAIKMCVHKKVAQPVTDRMCCAYWDAEGTLRAYGDQEIGK